VKELGLKYVMFTHLEDLTMYAADSLITTTLISCFARPISLYFHYNHQTMAFHSLGHPELYINSSFKYVLYEKLELM
jgi:hypothetical protein